MKVLVCGGRGITDTTAVYKALADLAKGWEPDVTIIEGDAKGVDRIAGAWARKRRLTNMKFPADWAKHGNAAGPIRNKRMLDEGRPDLVVAFPGGPGTANMVRQARAAGVPVVEVAAPHGFKLATTA